MSCLYFLDKLPKGATREQHLLPDSLYFPSPEEMYPLKAISRSALQKQFTFFAGSVFLSIYLLS